jgi:hypothetical protein
VVKLVKKVIVGGGGRGGRQGTGRTLGRFFDRRMAYSFNKLAEVLQTSYCIILRKGAGAAIKTGTLTYLRVRPNSRGALPWTERHLHSIFPC